MPGWTCTSSSSRCSVRTRTCCGPSSRRSSGRNGRRRQWVSRSPALGQSRRRKRVLTGSSPRDQCLDRTLRAPAVRPRSGLLRPRYSATGPGRPERPGPAAGRALLLRLSGLVPSGQGRGCRSASRSRTGPARVRCSTGGCTSAHRSEAAAGRHSPGPRTWLTRPRTMSRRLHAASVCGPECAG